MGVRASDIISRFFTRRDEVAGEVMSTAEAVALINEAQRELDGLKLLIKEAELEWVAGSAAISLPSDFMTVATDAAYIGEKAYLWLPYKGNHTEPGLTIIPGKKARLYPVPTETSTIRFTYYHKADEVSDDPGAEEAFGGADIPGVDKFILYRMLEAAAGIDEEDSRSTGMQDKANSAKSEIILWRQNTYTTDNSSWIPDPYITAHDNYVEDY